MPTTYDKAASARPYLDAMLKEHHDPLLKAQVTFDLLFATPEYSEKTGMPKSPPVKVGGYPCAAKVRIVSLKDRAKGCADVEIIIDAPLWKSLSDSRRRALMDHELTHLEFTGEYDDSMRPKLKLVLHDHQFGWFDVIARRHGDASFEVQQFQKFRMSQSYFAFSGEKEPAAA